MKIRKGDTVSAISGPDRDAQGKVIEVYLKRDKILVEGVNRIEKHVVNFATEHDVFSGGIVAQEAPIHVSNVILIDEDGIPTRASYRFDEDGRRIRISCHIGKGI